jgi:hypothetical protein
MQRRWKVFRIATWAGLTALLPAHVFAEAPAARNVTHALRAPRQYCLMSPASDIGAPATAPPRMLLRLLEQTPRRWLSQSASEEEPTALPAQRPAFYKRKWVIAGAVAVVAAAVALTSGGGGEKHTTADPALPGFPPPPAVR